MSMPDCGHVTDSSPLPGGDGSRTVNRHASDFFTPKHSGFDTPIRAPDFDSLSPGTFIDLHMFPEQFKDSHFAIGLPITKVMAFGLIYEETFLRSGSAGSLSSDAEVLATIKTFNDIVTRASTKHGLAITFGFLELLRRSADLAQQVSDASGTMPPSITIVKGTNTETDPGQPDFEGNPSLANLNSMRTAAGPATTGDWTHIFALFIGSFTDISARDEYNDNLEAFFDALNSGAYELSPFVELTDAQEYSGGTAVTALTTIGTAVPAGISNPSYFSALGLTPSNITVMKTNIFEAAMVDAALSCFAGWGLRLDYRSNDAVTNLAAVAAAGNITVTWDPPNGTVEYDATINEAIYISDDPLKLALTSNDIIPTTPGGGDFNPRNAPCAMRFTGKTGFIFSTNGWVSGRTVYFRIRTRSNPWAPAMTFIQFEPSGIVDGEESVIVSAVVV